MTIDYQKLLPARMKGLPVDAAGHPVPWFVAKIKGEYDFRVMDRVKIVAAVREGRCWVCGESMENARGTFVIGPMCAVNHVSSEPPSHYDCALYSATHCPWLITPRRKRRAKDMPEDSQSAGIMIERNPGVILVWTSKRWNAWNADNGVLFNIGEPIAVRWYREGRAATRDEVMESINSGIPTLRQVAKLEGPEATAALDRLYRRAVTVVEQTVTA